MNRNFADYKDKIYREPLEDEVLLAAVMKRQSEPSSNQQLFTEYVELALTKRAEDVLPEIETAYLQVQKAKERCEQASSRVETYRKAQTQLPKLKILLESYYSQKNHMSEFAEKHSASFSDKTSQEILTLFETGDKGNELNIQGKAYFQKNPLTAFRVRKDMKILMQRRLLRISKQH